MVTKVLHKLVLLIFSLLIAILVQRFAPKVFPRLVAALSRILPISAIPAPVWDWLDKLVSLALGLLIGVFVHYLIYRFTLPTKPFVYVAF